MHGPVAIILAAGQGKRMNSEKAKVLHEVCGQPMIRYVVDAARGAGAKTIVVVVGYAADQIREYLQGEPDILFATQTEQLGTGHAVKICRELLAEYQGPALVLVGDEPLLRPEPLTDLLERQQIDQAACLLGTAVMNDPMGFGRILRDSAGRFLRIVEERDCTPEERALTEVNPSCYVFELPVLWGALDRIGTSNAQGEYYLTDAPEQLKSMGMEGARAERAESRRCSGGQHPPAPGSSRGDHAIADPGPLDDRRRIDRRPAQHLYRRSSLDRPGHCDFPIHGDHRVGQDWIELPGRAILALARRDDPRGWRRYGGVRRDQTIAPGRGTMVRHLAYLGDAEVGEGVNIGATAITANFDGQRKNPTRIGDRSQIGAGAILVAPVTIGADAVVGANAVVTRDHDVAPGQTVVWRARAADRKKQWMTTTFAQRDRPDPSRANPCGPGRQPLPEACSVLALRCLC